MAVVQGSARRDAALVRLRFRPKGARGKPIALVGKGLCFDTGGVNLKPFRSMLGMHGDMQGSAVALGTLLALSRLRTDRPVDAWLALAENSIDAEAYKPQDVVTACDGTTIEVTHTDAEGRMVLADTLAIAARTRPKMIVDFATLTGACIYSLTTRYSGVFSNRPELYPTLIGNGIATGERVWPFPMDADYDDEIKSEVADVRQCSLDNEGDHIVAARFLSRFVPDDTPWLHMDLAASNRKGGLAHVPTEVTGFGVRYMTGLLLDAGLIDGPPKT